MSTRLGFLTPLTVTRHNTWLRRTAASTALVLSAALVAPGVATAAPDDTSAPIAEPTTADEAKQAWLDSAAESEQFGEKVLNAEEHVKQATAASTAAEKAVVDADRKVASADKTVQAEQQKVAQAQKKVDQAQQIVQARQNDIDNFADATFRGANTSTLGAFLTADSPEDFLDTASSLEVVAGDNYQLLATAEQAKQHAAAMVTEAAAVRNRAQAAKDQAQSLRDKAAAVKAKADAAKVASVAARKQLDADRVALDAKMVHYQQAYARLSDADRKSAVTAFEDRLAGANSVDLSVLAAKEAPSPQAGIAVAAALSREGLPYVWGAVGPNTFDCSGLMVWAWKQAGVDLPRTSYQQAAALPAIPLEDLRPGDLVTYYNPVHHVAMYIGDGLVIHAPESIQPVKIVALDRAGKLPVGRAVNR